MKTYSQLVINEKINLKGNIFNKANDCEAGERFSGSRIILEDLLATRFNFLRTENEIKAHLFHGQNLHN